MTTPLPSSSGTPSVSFAILSDLHLETPASRPTYLEFSFAATCPNLALLGDIGLANDPRLFTFLEDQLSRFKIVFYVLGNHEPYDSTLEAAREALKAFKDESNRRKANDDRLGNFILLDQVRYDLTPTITILGCTLFSSITSDQKSSVSLFVSDFSRIQDWNIDSHNSAHSSDLAWLNDQVTQIAEKEPERNIVIFTHYSPTAIPKANEPRHLQDANGVRSAFVTDLSEQACWTSTCVKLWAFGHTHFNCDFVEPVTKKRVFANQKGYRRSEAEGFDVEKVVTIVSDQESSVTLPETGSKQGSGKVGLLTKFLRRRERS